MFLLVGWLADTLVGTLVGWFVRLSRANGKRIRTVYVRIHCISELKVSYILTGKFQTDNLESRFGQYPQLSGGNYNISVHQIFECGKKIRMKSVLKQSLPFHNQNVVLKNFEVTNWEELKKCEQLDLCVCNLDVSVCEKGIDNCNDILLVMVYLAGYCCFAVLKKLKCNSCRSMITCSDTGEEIPESHSYTDRISRWSLLHPASITASIIMYNYIVINKLLELPVFCNATNQGTLAKEMTLIALADDDAFFPQESCDSDHNTERTEKNASLGFHEYSLE